MLPGICRIVIILLAAVFYIASAAITPAYAEDVPQWGRFEREFINTKSYNDPYRGVVLNVTYTKPDNSKVDFWGFYDGGNSWKIRFMPDQLGTWQYSASFSDGRPAGSGQFTVVPGDIPGMVSKDETNPIWFGYKGGKHGLFRGFHVGDRFFADNANGTSWSPAKRTEFLDWAQSMGYNFLSIASHYLNREQSGRGAGWDTPDLWDGSTRSLNAAEYKKMEAILDDLAARKMMVFPFAGWFGQSSDFPTNLADQELYIKYNLARIGPYWNVTFNVAGPEPLLKPDSFQNAMTEADINRIGAQIKSLDPFGHLGTIHNKTGNDPFRNQSWLGFSTLQGGKNFNYSSVNNYFLGNHTGNKPVYAQECFWPGNKYHMQYPSDDQIRKKGWTCQLSAVTINFADMDGNSSSGFSGSLLLEDKIQKRHDIMKRINDFIESIPFYRMSPDNSKTNKGFALVEDGEQYLVYLPSGGTVNISVKTGKTYKVTWVDPKDPAKKTAGGTTGNGQNLIPPSGGDDWLCYLTASTSNVVPQLNFLNPSNGAELEEGGSLYVEVNATDTDGSINNVKLYLNDEFVRQENRFPYEWNAPGQNDPLLKNLAAGTYQLKAIATDNEGKSSTKEITVNVNSQNQAPSLSFLSPSNGAELDEGESLYVEVNATDTDGSVSNVKLYLNDQFVRQENIFPYQWNAPGQNDPLLKNLAAGTYQLKAIATDNEGKSSSKIITVSVSAPDTLPDGWSATAIGSTGADVTFSNGNYTLSAAGADIWGQSDAFGFVQQEWSGDVTVIAKVNSLTNTHEWAKAGIMIRDTNDADSAHAMIVVTPERGVSFQRRINSGESSKGTTIAGIEAPQWLKLTRTGNTVRAYYSADGGSWIPLGKDTINLQSNVQVGMVLTSHDSTKTATASFSGVEVKDPQDELVITKYILVNADTDQDIKEIFQNETIDLLQLGHNISLKVEVNDSPGSIVFKVNGDLVQIENNPGYYINGNSGSDVNVWDPPTGTVTVETTPMSQSGGSGISGETLKIKLNIKK